MPPIDDTGKVGFAIRYIQLERKQTVTVFVGEIRERLEIAGGSGDAVTALESRDCPLSSEAARGACDEPVLCHDSTLEHRVSWDTSALVVPRDLFADVHHGATAQLSPLDCCAGIDSGAETDG